MLQKINIPKYVYGEIKRDNPIELPEEEKILEVVKQFGEKLIGKELVIDDSNRNVILNLIKWAANDRSFPGDLRAGIGLIGPPGTGKTRLLQILQAILRVQKINYYQYYTSWNQRPLDYEIFSASRLCSAFQNDGYDGLHNFCNYPIVAIDDLGAESNKTKHWGSDLAVLEHVLQYKRLHKLFYTLYFFCFFNLLLYLVLFTSSYVLISSLLSKSRYSKI